MDVSAIEVIEILLLLVVFLPELPLFRKLLHYSFDK